MTNSNHYPQQREAIVDKLNGALATFRRERDDVHRSKELAIERLLLIREERVIAERNVHSMQEKYDQMMESMSSSRKLNGNGARSGSTRSSSNNDDDEIVKLQVEVERLSREAKFQHGELVSKREKLSQLESSIKEEEKNRTSYIRLAREAVRKRREKVAIQAAKDDSRNSPARNEAEEVETVLNLLRNNGDELDVYTNLQRLIEKNASDVEDEVTAIQHNANLVRKRIAGYTQLLHTNGDNTAVMCQ